MELRNRLGREVIMLDKNEIRVADKPQLAAINGVAQILPEVDYLQRGR